MASEIANTDNVGREGCQWKEAVVVDSVALLSDGVSIPVRSFS